MYALIRHRFFFFIIYKSDIAQLNTSYANNTYLVCK